MTSIQEFIKDIKELKPIPAVTNQLLEILDKPDFSIEDIANIIQYDPIITATVLKTCNSAFFGLKNPAESIKDAVNMMGTDQIIELVLLKSGTEMLGKSSKGYGLEAGDMLKYSLSSAVIAKEVAVNLGLKNKNTIFTSALLKDIGKIVLEKHVANSSKQIKNLVGKKNFSFQEAEKKTFGIDHAELGAIIATIWKLSPKMVKIIKHHHLSDEAMINDKEVAAVYLSDCICMMIGIGVGSDGLAYRFKNKAMDRLGVSANDISLIIAKFGIDMQEIEKLLDIF